MPSSPRPTDPRSLDALADRGKPPASKSVLDRWVNEVANVPPGADVARLSHLIVTTVAVAVLQQAVDDSNTPMFLLKGGTYLQYRLPEGSRATKDIDGLVRGDLESFLTALDRSLAQEWGAFTLQRTEAEVIAVPGKVTLPRRFHLKLLIRGEVWRKVKVEVSPDEGGAGDHHEILAPADLRHFGLRTPDQLIGVAVRYQVAQKVHACTDPHDPPASVNERARDLPDLLLLRRLTVEESSPTLLELQQACIAVFGARAKEAEEAGHDARHWPPVVTAHPGWDIDYAKAAAEAGLSVTMVEAIAELNDWIRQIASAG